MSNYTMDALDREREKERTTDLGFGRDDQENMKRLKIREDLEKSMSQKQKEHLTQYNSRLEKEEVTNPKHYDQVGFGIQPLEYIIANELDFLEGNIIKYVSRYPHKGGVNDLLKARTYLEKLIEIERIKNE